MKFKFNKNCSESEKRKIKYLFGLVKSNSAKDLLVRVVIHRPHVHTSSDGSTFTYFRTTRKHGYYKNINEHGFYNSEFKEVFQKKNCRHIIHLHLKENEHESSIAEVMAHEWRHYLQYTKPSLRKKYVIKHGHLEVDADRYAKKIVQKLIASRHINPKIYQGIVFPSTTKFFEELI